MFMYDYIIGAYVAWVIVFIHHYWSKYGRISPAS
jgi:hypothetical protein